MKLEELSRRTKLDALMYLERFVCQKFHHAYANYSEVSKQFQPQNVSAPFSLPLVKKGLGQVTIFGEDEFLKSVLEIGFPIHPDTITDLNELEFEIADKLFVLPTCSTRTLLVHFNNMSRFLKVHIERHISRIRRRVTLEDVKKDTYVSSIIKKEIINKKTPSDFAFLLGTGGAVLSTKGKDIGAIVRDIKPFPDLSNGKYLVPIFSLYSKDQYTMKDKPLLVQMIDRSRSDPIDYVIRNIAAPIMKHFDFFARTMNILLQPHAQNTLIELDENFSILRIVHRDIPSRVIDTGLAKEKERWAPHIEYSIFYDNYLCRDSLQLLGNVLVDYYAVDMKKFITAVKRCFDETITIKDRFPKEEYSLPEKLMERSEPIILSKQTTYR